MADESGNYTFGYDNRGRLTSKTSVISGITYNLARSYTPGSRVTSITYPSGRTVNYYRTECACKVDSITTSKSGVTNELMQNITYRPFGGMKSMSIGAGGKGTVSSSHGSSGRLTASNSEAVHSKSYTHDNNGNLKSVTAGSFSDQSIYK
jgi:hypothetical protein